MAKLTTKQEKFAQHWYLTGNKSEAYRVAYDAENMSESVVNVKASELSKNGKVAVRYKELSGEGQKRLETTVDIVDSMYKSAWKVAKEKDMPSAMVSAAGGLAKLHGLNAPDKQQVEHSGTPEAPIVSVYLPSNSRDVDSD